MPKCFDHSLSVLLLGGSISCDLTPGSTRKPDNIVVKSRPVNSRQATGVDSLYHYSTLKSLRLEDALRERPVQSELAAKAPRRKQPSLRTVARSRGSRERARERPTRGAGFVAARKGTVLRWELMARDCQDVRGAEAEVQTKTGCYDIEADEIAHLPQESITRVH